jgi:hypothetical protein
MVNSHRPLARVVRGVDEVVEEVEVAEVVEVVTEGPEVVPVPVPVEVPLEVEVLPVAPLEVSMPLTRRPSLLLELRIVTSRYSLALVHSYRSYSTKTDHTYCPLISKSESSLCMPTRYTLLRNCSAFAVNSK